MDRGGAARNCNGNAVGGRTPHLHFFSSHSVAVAVALCTHQARIELATFSV